jgi:hypothetical protein
MWEISLTWQEDPFQIFYYIGIVLVILWILSKIELPDRGDAPTVEDERVRG